MRPKSITPVAALVVALGLLAGCAAAASAPPRGDLTFEGSCDLRYGDPCATARLVLDRPAGARALEVQVHNPSTGAWRGYPVSLPDVTTTDVSWPIPRRWIDPVAYGGFSLDTPQLFRVRVLIDNVVRAEADLPVEKSTRPS